MNTTLSHDAPRRPTSVSPWPWRKALLLFLPLLLLVPAGTPAGAPGNVHAAVFAWAQEHPGEPVPVIVQAEQLEGTAAAIRQHGGTVERELALIQSIDATVPPGALGAIAADDAVAWISLDASVATADGGSGSTWTSSNSGSGSGLSGGNAYPYTVDADDAWSQGYIGAGVAVAVVDTGISPSGHEDFKNFRGNSRVVAEVVVNQNTSNVTDGYGHGTHIAGIVGGNGKLLKGKYMGVAPGVNLVNVKVGDEEGSATLADVVAGLQWVYENRLRYNIRVVNLSLHSSVQESYQTSPLSAAVEYLWFNGVFVVVAAGNNGSAPDAVFYPPSNDPFVMTAGALDDMGTNSHGDDAPTPWSSNGVTQDGFRKPELLTPGNNIVSVIDTNSILYKENPKKVMDEKYLKLSGTSMAAGVMSGVAALAFQAHPYWTPGQVKCTLIATASNLSGDFGAFSVPDTDSVTGRWSPSCDSDANLAPSLGFTALAKTALLAYVLGAADPAAAAAEAGLDPAEAGIAGKTLLTVDWSAI